jgi:multiple sugar transport system substrate-binding protein
MGERSSQASRRAFVRTAFVGTTMALAGSILAACSGIDTSSTATSTSGGKSATDTTAATPVSRGLAAAAAPPENVHISVSVWSDVTDLEINRGVIDAYRKRNPKVTVSPEQWTNGYYEKLRAAVAGGNVPDLVYFQGWMWQPYALNNQLRDLGDYIAQDKSALPADMFPRDLDAYVRQLSLKGKHYGVPVDTGSMVMFYNQDVFDLARVSYPRDGWTQQDFLDTCQKVQDGLRRAGKENVFAYQPNYGDVYVRNFRWWRANGGMEFDQLEDPRKAQWDQPEVAAAWQGELYDLASKGLAISRAALLKGGGPQAFYTYGIQNGLVAMKLEGPWFLPQMWGPKAVTKGGVRFDVVQAPQGSRGFSEFWQVNPITIWKTSMHPDECWDYLKFAASADGQRFVAEGGRMTNTPSSIVKEWVPLVQKLYNFQNAAAFASADGASIVATGGVNTDDFAARGGLNAARDAVIDGSKTAKEALAVANGQCQAVLDGWWKAHPNG